MANETLNVILKLITGQYVTAARGAATATGQIGTAATQASGAATGAFGRMSGAIGAVRGGLAGLGLSLITSQLDEMATAAADDAKAQETLAFAIRNNIGATDEQIQANERWITSMQLATNTADVELRGAMQSLIVTGASLEESQRIIATSLDIAAARGKEFGTVIEAMVKAQNGSFVGLQRLGIATRDAAGEMLTFDQILQNAATTMGGSAAEGAATMAGAMERAKIIMQEANEAAGVPILGQWSKFKDQLAIITTRLKGGNVELAVLNERFNSLIRQGIDPFNDKGKSMVDILHSMLEETSVSADTLETLTLMLGLSDDEIRTFSDTLRKNGRELGFNAEQVDAMTAALDRQAPDEHYDGWMKIGTAYGKVGDAARYLAGQVPKAIPVIQNLTTELLLAAEAGENVQRVLLTTTDPLFAAIESWTNYSEALKIADEDGKRTAEESIALLRDELQLLAVMADLDPAGYERAMEAIELSTGKTREEVELLFESLGLFDGKTFTATVRANITMEEVVNTRGVSSGVRGAASGSPFDPYEFASGGVVPGPRGSPQLILAHAGETVLPTHKPGFTLQSFADGGVVGVTGSPITLQSFADGGVVGIGGSQITLQSFADGGVVGGSSWSSQMMLNNQMMIPVNQAGVTRNVTGPTINVINPTSRNLDLDLQYGALLANHMTLLD